MKKEMTQTGHLFFYTVFYFPILETGVKDRVYAGAKKACPSAILLRCRQQLLRIFFLRMIVNFIHGSLLYNSSLFHDKDSVAELIHDVEIV